MSTPHNQKPSATPPSEVATTVHKRPSRWVTPTLALVAAIGAGIFGGILIGQHTAAAAAPTSQASGFRGGAGGTGAAGTPGGVTAGTVVSVKGNTLVLKTAAGTDVTVTTNSTTSVTKSTKSSVSALTAGESVTAIGQPDSGGTITATTIAEGNTPPRGFGGAGANG
ncbi:MAG: hypothetical protein JWR36_2539 [Glaciihabitans sp.]|nr:hypothetical protein [Glaciihabitans sp.]